MYDGYFADPFVMWTQNGYVAIGTSPAEEAGCQGRRFRVLTSSNLVDWEDRGGALVDPGLGDEYWAPEVLHADGAWLMYYSVGNGIHGHHIRVAKAATPMGPYEDLGLNLTEDERFAIDPHPFVDEDGTTYLFFARDVLEGDRVGTHLAVARLETPTRLGPIVEVLRPYADWQLYQRGRHMYDGRYDWHTLEGPSVVRRGGRYWMTFSGGAWTGPGYQVSWAVADHPLGPWEPAEARGGSPILRTTEDLIGPGHNSLVTGPEGNDVIAFHAWNATRTRRELHLRRIQFLPTGPIVGTPLVPSPYESAAVRRTAQRLADGREILYFDDPRTHLSVDRAVDGRVLPPRPGTASMRLDVLTGEWITHATARGSRVVLPPAHLDPLAPQSPGNPSEIPSEYDVVVFENRSPAFGPSVAEEVPEATHPAAEPEFALGRTRPAVGRCEVICFSPEPEGSFGSLSPTRARTVIEAWADRTAELSAVPGVAQVIPFENRGEAIGVTLPHPHGQIYAYPYITPRTARLLDAIQGYGPSLLGDVLAFECEGERVVLSAEHWTAYVPFAARWPIEVHLMPHRHVPDLAATTHEERDELAIVYLRLLRGIDAIYGDPTPYIAAWHQAPVHVHRDTVRLTLQLTSPRRAEDKLKFLAGSEAAMGAWVSDVSPEAQAEQIRAAISRADKRASV